MSEMTKIVLEHIPVEDLPQHLRAGLLDGQLVRVTVETESSGRPLPKSLRSFIGASTAPPLTTGEIVSQIRELRDEWDR